MRDTGDVLAAASNKVAGGDYRTNHLFFSLSDGAKLAGHLNCSMMSGCLSQGVEIHLAVLPSQCLWSADRQERGTRGSMERVAPARHATRQVAVLLCKRALGRGYCHPFACCLRT